MGAEIPYNFVLGLVYMINFLLIVVKDFLGMYAEFA